MNSLLVNGPALHVSVTKISLPLTSRTLKGQTLDIFGLLPETSSVKWKVMLTSMLNVSYVKIIVWGLLNVLQKDIYPLRRVKN